MGLARQPGAIVERARPVSRNTVERRPARQDGAESELETGVDVRGEIGYRVEDEEVGGVALG